jgi:hypothetical protein
VVRSVRMDHLAVNIQFDMTFLPAPARNWKLGIPTDPLCRGIASGSCSPEVLGSNAPMICVGSQEIERVFSPAVLERNGAGRGHVSYATVSNTSPMNFPGKSCERELGACPRIDNLI